MWLGWIGSHGQLCIASLALGKAVLYKTSSWAEHSVELVKVIMGCGLGYQSPDGAAIPSIAPAALFPWRWYYCCKTLLVAITMVTGFLCSILQYREDSAGSSFEGIGACRESRSSLEGIRSSWLSWQGQKWWLYQVCIFAHKYVCTIICSSSFLILHCTKIGNCWTREVGCVTKFTNLQRLVVCGRIPPTCALGHQWIQPLLSAITLMVSCQDSPSVWGGHTTRLKARILAFSFFLWLVITTFK